MPEILHPVNQTTCPAVTETSVAACSSAPVFSPETPWLAPLAGWSDLPFRLLCRELGASVCCTEMISAKGLVYGSPGTSELLRTLPEDAPLVAQLFGAEAPFMEEAVHRLRAQNFEWFDCNMGCSVPKVNRSGSGSAMMRDIPNALAVAEAMLRAAGPGRVGFKIRLGWDTSTVWRELATELQALGAGWITLHPRTAKQGFTGQARHEFLYELKQSVRIPVLASGDLFSASDGVRCLQQTGVDAIMYARGALRNPAIFAEHKARIRNEPDPGCTSTELRARILRHAELARLHSPDRAALLKMRTIVPRYVRELQGSRALRLAVIACRDWDDFYTAIEQWSEGNK